MSGNNNRLPLKNRHLLDQLEKDQQSLDLDFITAIRLINYF